MFGNKEIIALNELTAVNTFCMLLLNIESEDKKQRRSLEEYYNYLRDLIHTENVLQILDNNWMRWVGSLPIDEQSEKSVSHE